MWNKYTRESSLLKVSRASAARYPRHIFKLGKCVVEKCDRNKNTKGILKVNRLSCNGHGEFLLRFTVFD